MKLSEANSSYTLFSQKKPLKWKKFVLGILILSACISIIFVQFYLADHSTKKEISLCEIYKVSTTPSKSFSEQMQSFPWQPYRNAVNRKDILAIRHYSELLLTSILIPFTIQEPLVPVNSSCYPPPIQEPEKIRLCVQLQHPRRVGVILNFGFDVAALELHLHELDAVVDKFFLMEGTKIHNRYLDTKPSIWDMVKYTPRFSKFHHKIVHFIVDDSDYADTEKIRFPSSILPDMWSRENLQKKIRLQKFLEWNAATKYFGPQDIIGIGDTDEIPSRNVVNFLKSCELHNENMQIGIWFPFPYIDTVFSSDFPVDGHPFTFSRPVYSTVISLTNSLTQISKEISSPKYGSILGGLHFSKYFYLPFECIKALTSSESELRSLKYIIDIGLIYKSNNHSNSEEKENLLFNIWLDRWKGISHRIKSVDWFRETFGDYETNMIIKLPWFYKCNPARFPSFHRKPDLRLQ